MRFAVHGPPSRWTAVHGFDRTSYNAQNASARPGHDVWSVTGVYGGWTASDITARTSDVARLAYDIFGAHGPRVLTAASVATMVPKNTAHHFPYGFATFNLSDGYGVSAGKAKNYNTAYGHLGATYGYQSIVAYFPAADVSLAIASNIETDDQVTWHAILHMLRAPWSCLTLLSPCHVRDLPLHLHLSRSSQAIPCALPTTRYSPLS